MKENFYSKNKTKFLKMLNSGKPKFNKSGRIVKEAEFQKKTCDAVSRIAPDRKYFRGTRTITQVELENFRNTVDTVSPYNVLLAKGKAPFSLLNESQAEKRNFCDHENVFGKKAKRRKPNLNFNSLNELAESVENKKIEEVERKENNTGYVKGQSKRIWNELYKVIDSSDVIVHVLDARDPMGTRCECVESYIKKNAPHKHLIYVLNKVDLVPTGVTAKWMALLSKNYPIVAYHANSLQNFYGKSNLLNIFRQFSKLHSDKKQISIGFFGYPNTGKSSIINTLRNKIVCSVAPIPGQTKVWQYITLMKKIYLIDCPGVVPYSTETEAVLKGAVRIENLEDPETYVEEILKSSSGVVSKTYDIKFKDCKDFLEKISYKYGKLLKDGEPNINMASKMVLHDWLKGKIPYFKVPETDN